MNTIENELKDALESLTGEDKLRLDTKDYNSLKRFLPVLGDYFVNSSGVTLSNVTTIQFQKFLNETVKENSKPTQRKKLKTLKTLGKILNILGINHNDFSSLELPGSKLLKTELEPMQDEDFLELIKCLRDSNSKAKYIPEIVDSVGVDLFEAVAIREENIDLKNCSVYIEDSRFQEKRTVFFEKEDLLFWKFLKEETIKNSWKTITGNLRAESIQVLFFTLFEKFDREHKYIRNNLDYVRYRFSQRRYNKRREKGLTPDVAMRETKTELGLEENRNKAFTINLEKNYVERKYDFKKRTRFLFGTKEPFLELQILS